MWVNIVIISLLNVLNRACFKNPIFPIRQHPMYSDVRSVIVI